MTGNLEATCQSNFYSLVVTPVIEAGYVNIYGTNITKIKKAEDELRKYREHLEEVVCERTEKLNKVNEQLMQQIDQRKTLEKEILNISEKEQQRFGQELHDSLGQQLTGISFMAHVLQQKLSQKNLPETEDIRKISALVNEAARQARALAKGLHPVDLDSGSLISSLEELAHSTERLFAVRCDFEYEKNIELHDAESAVHLYRIAQEAITNAIKHAKAEKITIHLFDEDQNGILTIKNDGEPFPKKNQTSNDGMGLQIMAHRVDLLGGQMTINKDLKDGTVIQCIFPIKKLPKLRIVEYEKSQRTTKENSHSR
jgi:signal transduction histidine kinase